MGQADGTKGSQPSPTLLPPSLSTFRGDFARVSTRRSGRNGTSKFTKLIGNRGRDGKEAVEGISKPYPASHPCGDVNIKLVVDPAQRFKYGRRTSISEALLGLATTPFPDGQRIMVAGFSAMSHPDLHQIIKVGDWLKSIEGTDVTIANLESYLLTIENITEVQIVVQRLSTAGECKYSNVSAIVKSLDVLMPIEEEEELSRMVFTLMYLTMEDTTEQGPEGQDVMFCYPGKNLTELYATRGTFLTINSLAKVAFNTTPVTSSVMILERSFTVVYHPFNNNNELLLMAFPEEILNASESVLKSQQIQRYLEFCFRTVPGAFVESNANQLKDVCKLIERSLLQHLTKPINFHESMIEAHSVPLPKEAQLRIDDALSEMEAMDYREWNDDPIKSHREFFVIGSALFYEGYLLASHLPVEDLVDINAYLRTMAVTRLMENPDMREMLVWREVYLKSCERGIVKNEQMYGIPQGRWFLSIVAKGHLLLAVLLESRYTDQKYQFINPAPFYVEEIQDTVEHLRNGGIESLTATWLTANKRPRCALKDKSEVVQLSSSAPNKKSDSVLPFLKPRRSTSTENLQGSHRSSSMNSKTPSEDSHNKYDDGDSDSDWDGFPESHKSSSGFDVSEMTETLLKEVGDILPSKLTSGLDNVLFHYVQLDVGEGLLMAPTVNIHPMILEAFRNAAHSIHEVLQNTIRFRQQLALEVAKPAINKSSVAVKEHGVLISAAIGQEETLEFWVIGRLFLATGRETYLCHRADIPQNMVEIAYRLQLNATG